ncbi:hypothetical protein [Saccharothrix syringae]|uniref:Uncharacterized protein n=1 Tax=Saccharothrix syringae TaxID=103733 RepID=A0A5Q0H140_SACSY|nr:hypothetical protein [Saccharothrix syringae]QFZ19918.1 hypothetical protein EKG83_23030 [Saccharothrix syringae]
MTPLEVRLHVVRDLVRVALVNTGDATVVVAGRLAVGYEGGTDRELYAVLRDPVTGEAVGGPAQLYHRAPHPADDLRPLAPGQRAGTAFRLGDWYTHPAGALEVSVVYDPTEVARRFPGVHRDRVVSDAVRVDLPGNP